MMIQMAEMSSMLIGFTWNLSPFSAPHTLSSSVDSPRSPTDFGIKTRNSQLLSEIAEMELSQDYTCVALYGPNPKTVHIFGDYIVKSCSGHDQFSSPPKSPKSFLTSCRFCKKKSCTSE
ncbi:hypothetical protein SAY86_005054 [Trapa natans]|uniref:Uncharacterized protein n=1 Tax=Trapa natans TaxID=22666 RepID=A0AAN7L046_TRANT|nr:hypothetical protein SAY86_005054 [Trapa natans]